MDIRVGRVILAYRDGLDLRDIPEIPESLVIPAIQGEADIQE